MNVEHEIAKIQQWGAWAVAARLGRDAALAGLSEPDAAADPAHAREQRAEAAEHAAILTSLERDIAAVFKALELAGMDYPEAAERVGFDLAAVLRLETE